MKNLFLINEVKTVGDMSNGICMFYPMFFQLFSMNSCYKKILLFFSGFSVGNSGGVRKFALGGNLLTKSLIKLTI